MLVGGLFSTSAPCLPQRTQIGLRRAARLSRGGAYPSNALGGMCPNGRTRALSDRFLGRAALIRRPRSSTDDVGAAGGRSAGRRRSRAEHPDGGKREQGDRYGEGVEHAEAAHESAVCDPPCNYPGGDGQGDDHDGEQRCLPVHNAVEPSVVGTEGTEHREVAASPPRRHQHLMDDVEDRQRSEDPCDHERDRTDPTGVDDDARRVEAGSDLHPDVVRDSVRRPRSRPRAAGPAQPLSPRPTDRSGGGRRRSRAPLRRSRPLLRLPGAPRFR